MTKDWEATWNAVCDELRATGLEVLRAAPDSELARGEGLRYVSRLFRNAVLMQLEARSPGRPVISHETPRVGGDNPDYRYGSAALEGSLTYRLRGRINDAARLGIGTYSGGLGTPQGLVCTGYVSSEQLALAPDGSFELTLSLEPPPQGAWLPMRPETNSLLVRETLLRPGSDRPAVLSIECLTPAQPARVMDAEALHTGLERAAGFVGGTVRQFLRWTKAFEAHPNEILPLDPALLAGAQGDVSTLYFNGYFRLPDAEHALVVRFRPPACQYWNLQLSNHWLESLDIVQTPAHYNHATAHREAEGSVRFVIAARDPRTPNWLDTVGHLEGGITLRIVGAAPDHRQALPDCRLMPLAEITPET